MVRVTFLIGFYVINALLTSNAFAIIITMPLLLFILIKVYAIRDNSLTVDDVFWFSTYLFLVIGPCQTVTATATGLSESGRGQEYFPYEIVWAMVIAFIFLASFALGDFRRSSINWSENNQKLWGYIVAINVVSFILLVITSGGLANLLAPRMLKSRESQSVISLLFLAFQTVSLCILAASPKTHSKKFRIAHFSIIFVLISLMLVSQNPFNTPRFFLLASWGPIALTLLAGRVRAVTFYVASLAAIVLLLPILSVTTRFGADYDRAAIAEFSLNNLLLLPYIDVFDTLVHAIHLMRFRDFYWGENLTAILLFFIPRAIWPEKPVVGGLEIGRDMFALRVAGTENLSFFVAGDFYMDFGFLGVIFGGLICGLAYSSLKRAKFGRVNGQNLHWYFLMTSLPILIRGPLGAVIPLFACQISALWMLSRLFHAEKVQSKA